MAIAGVILVTCHLEAQQVAAPPARQSTAAMSDSDLIVLARGNNINVCADLYNRAKGAFKDAQWDRALELTAGLATAPTSKTEHTHLRGRSRTLRAVIFAGQIKGNMALAEAYAQGVNKAKKPKVKTAYQGLQNNYLQAAAHAALGLSETVHLIVPHRETETAASRPVRPPSGRPYTIPLEVSVPPGESPREIAALTRVKEGGWIEPDQQESAAADSLRKGMDEAVEEVVSGDMAKARTVFADGPANMDAAAYVIFLSQELVQGAIVFDRHHTRDPQKLKMLCGEGLETLQAAQAILKIHPDKDKEKEAQKLQDKINTLLTSG
jgi:hypothetical protein